MVKWPVEFQPNYLTSSQIMSLQLQNSFNISQKSRKSRKNDKKSFIYLLEDYLNDFFDTFHRSNPDLPTH